MSKPINEFKAYQSSYVEQFNIDNRLNEPYKIMLEDIPYSSISSKKNEKHSQPYILTLAYKL
jgi:hypothetical protein